MDRAFVESKKCSLMVVVGSTLLVQPAASLPSVAKESGAYLAIINLSKTSCDDVCDILIKEKAGITIDAIVKGVRQKMLKIS